MPTGLDDAAWENIRAQFILRPGTGYMNNASLGMPPVQVVQAVSAGYEAISRDPILGKQELQLNIAERVKPAIASLFGTASSEISLTRNATEALHLQAIGLNLSPKAEVIITTQEHPAGHRPWMFRKIREGIDVSEVFIPSPFANGDEIVERLEDAITSRTRAICFCHVTRGGHRYPVEKITRMAKSHDVLTLVDGAQAVGQFPIDLESLGCDAYAASLHKWMLAPVGTGFLYVREQARDRIRTAFAPDATLESPAYDPPGTVSFPVRSAVSAALDFVNVIGLGLIEARCRHLSSYLKRRLSAVDGVTMLSGSTVETCAPGSTIFEVAGLDAVQAVSLLAERAQIHIDEHQRDGHNAIRVSTHIYNTTAEIDRLTEVLEGFVRDSG
jgi:selenocysteine lyase/cysteine desulfurase